MASKRKSQLCSLTKTNHTSSSANRASGRLSALGGTISYCPYTSQRVPSPPGDQQRSPAADLRFSKPGKRGKVNPTKTPLTRLQKLDGVLSQQCLSGYVLPNPERWEGSCLDILDPPVELPSICCQNTLLDTSNRRIWEAKSILSL